jgi:myo-inositol-1(or 4)-monophosphatase
MTDRHLAVMGQAAARAARILLKYYGRVKPSQVRSKSLNDFVTFVDKTSQRIIVDTLKSAFPLYGFQAEEGGLVLKKKRMWVIDPLDGTSNYIHQFPMFCISIALVEEGRPVIGLVYDPLHQDRFTAVRHNGARCNGIRIRVSKTPRLKQAFLATGFPFRERRHFDPYHRSFRRIFYGSAGIRRGGSAALDLCYTACGRVDGFWEWGLAPWDVAAGALVIEEAGGVVTEFKGTEHHLDSGNIVAGNPAVHRGLVRILKGVRGFS